MVSIATGLPGGLLPIRSSAVFSCHFVIHFLAQEFSQLGPLYCWHICPPLLIRFWTPGLTHLHQSCVPITSLAVLLQAASFIGGESWSTLSPPSLQWFKGISTGNHGLLSSNIGLSNRWDLSPPWTHFSQRTTPRRSRPDQGDTFIESRDASFPLIKTNKVNKKYVWNT